MANQTQRLCSLGYMAQMIQRPVSQIQKWLEEISAEPVVVVNGVALYSAETHNAVILHMCRTSKTQLGASASSAPMIHTEPMPVEFLADDDDDGGDDQDQDEADDDPTPPILGNRLAQFLERANHG